MKKFIVTGGPHSGKTSLIEALKCIRSDYVYIPEAATVIINEESARETAEPGYRGILPWHDYPAFSDLVIETTSRLESEALRDQPQGTVAILDRSHIDTIGYASYHGQQHSIPRLNRLIHAAGYTAAFFCEQIPNYQQTEVRGEDEATALAIRRLLHEAYTNSMIPMYPLSPCSIANRADMVLDIIGDRKVAA